jgi:hypothetical protein
MSRADNGPASDEYALVPATSVGHKALGAFVARIWPEEAPERRIRTWWWKRAGPSFAVAAVHQQSGAMAGLCGGRHCEWIIANKSFPAVAICDWYVSAEHAGKGIGKRLVEHFTAPERFLYAFSISDAAIVNFKKLGWTGPHYSLLMLLPVPPIIARYAFGAPKEGLELQDHELVNGAALGALGLDLEHVETLRTKDATAHMRRGTDDWSWRLSVCGERRYRVCVARRAGEPVGYVVVRRITEGRSRQLQKLRAAIISDLVAAKDDPAVLHALASRAVAIAANLKAMTLVTATTARAHQDALAKAGFLTPASPLLGRQLRDRAPQFMWLPRGAGSTLTAGAMALTFADVAVDLDL